MEKQTTGKCIKCQKESSEGRTTSKGFICSFCLSRQKKRNAGIITGVLLLCVITAGGIYYAASSDNTKGFDGVSNIQDSMNVVVETPEKPEFNMGEAIAINAPVNVGETLDNIESFKRIMAQNIEYAKTTNDGSINIPTISILFNFDSYSVNRSAHELLNEYAKTFSQTNQQATILIQGYACDYGTNEVNDRISRQRAETVKEILKSQGINANNIKTEWYGKSKNKDFSYPAIKDYRRVIVLIK